MRVRAFLSLLVACGAAPAAAAPAIDLNGNVRARLDTIANQARASFRDDETLLNLRTTVTLKMAGMPACSSTPGCAGGRYPT